MRGGRGAAPRDKGQRGTCAMGHFGEGTLAIGEGRGMGNKDIGDIDDDCWWYGRGAEVTFIMLTEYSRG